MENQQYINMSNFENIHFWFKARRKILNFFLKQVIKENNINILEIGTGTGGNIKLLEKYGKYHGIEFSETAIKIIQEKFQNQIEIKKGSYPNTSFDKKFDLIVLFDVLEHIEKEEETLNEIKKTLNENGLLFITVPAYNFLWSNHDEIHHHKRRYTMKELENKLKKQGFKIKKSTYFNTFLFPIIFITRMLKNFFKLKDNDDKMPNNILNKILYKIFVSEIFFLKKINFNFGTSILIIAEKE